MNLTVVPVDKKIVKNGEPLLCSFTLPGNIHAIQWDESEGHIEYADGRRHKKLSKIQDIPKFNEILLAFKEAKKSMQPSKYHSWNEDIEEWEETKETKEKKAEKEAAEKAKKDKLKNNVFYGLSADEAAQVINDSPDTAKACKELMKDIIKLCIG